MVASVPLDTRRTCSTGLDPADDLLGERDLVLAGRPEREAPAAASGHGLADGRVAVAQDHRAPRADQVDVLPAVGVAQVGPVAGDHEPRSAADRVERPDGRVHAARGHRERALEQGLGGGGGVGVGRWVRGHRACPSLAMGRRGCARAWHGARAGSQTSGTTRAPRPRARRPGAAAVRGERAADRVHGVAQAAWNSSGGTLSMTLRRTLSTWTRATSCTASPSCARSGPARPHACPAGRPRGPPSHAVSRRLAVWVSRLRDCTTRSARLDMRSRRRGPRRAST